jgi:hypothetical protein
MTDKRDDEKDSCNSIQDSIMNVYTIDRAVLLTPLIVSLIYFAGMIKTAVPNRIRRLYPFRVNMDSILPFSTRWQKEIAPENLDAFRKFRRWSFAGLTAVLVVGLLKAAYFEFFFMRVHGFDLLAKNMALHVEYTALRPQNDADKARAATLVTDLQHALAKYQDYHVAETEGFAPLDPKLKVPVQLFVKNLRGAEAAVTFDPNQPHWLLYQPTPDGGYKLIGATYVDRKDSSEEQLNQHVPLSVARWHRDVNLCVPGRGTDAKTTDWTKFDTDGSIATRQACDAVGGRFFPVLSGWTVEVHPWVQNPKLVWQQ